MMAGEDTNLRDLPLFQIIRAPREPPTGTSVCWHKMTQGTVHKIHLEETIFSYRSLHIYHCVL